MSDKRDGSLIPRPRSSRDETETEGLTITKPRPKVTKPSLYRVILLNDDYTPMDFVTHVLKKFFHKSEQEATEIMLEVHHKGAGLAGVFTHEVAETKSYLVNEFAKGHRHPLKSVVEKEDESDA